MAICHTFKSSGSCVSHITYRVSSKIQPRAASPESTKDEILLDQRLKLNKKIQS